jgi:NitT/TauT family transport system permease protein
MLTELKPPVETATPVPVVIAPEADPATGTSGVAETAPESDSAAAAGYADVNPASPRRGPTRDWRGPLRSGVLALLSLAIGVTLWHFASVNKLSYGINFAYVPPPADVLEATMANLADPIFFVHIGVSMQRVFISFILAAGLGVLTGLLMGRSSAAWAMIAPYIEIMRPIPAVAWIPLAILMWPTEESSIVFITFLGAFFPIVLNTVHGVRQTPEVLVRAVQSLGANRVAVFRHVVLPAALPSISAGLAIGMGVAWFSLLAGEIISGQYGIGYFTWDAYSMVRTPDIVLGMLTIGMLGTLSTAAVRLATAPFLVWQTRAR